MSIFRSHKTRADRSAADRKRHRQKIDKAIKEGIHHILSDESIIGQDGKKKFRIPVRGIKEYRFIYGENNRKAAQAGEDDSPTKGQVVGKPVKKKAQGKAGNQPGEEIYEVELTLDELAEYLFDDLDLPDLEKKSFRNIEGEKRQRKGKRIHGILPRLDKKETLRQMIRRRAIAKRTDDFNDEEDKPFSINNKDLRYRHITTKPDDITNAVIFFVMDTSGSMTREKKFLARTFFFLVYQFLRYRYKGIEVVFISHDAKAQEVDEKAFFTKASSGGTLILPAIELTSNVIYKRFHPSSWNIYIFQCSDGDTWTTEDAQSAASIISNLKEISQMICYLEVLPLNDWPKDVFGTDTALWRNYTPYFDSKFKSLRITEKEDIWPAFKQLFGGAK